MARIHYLDALNGVAMVKVCKDIFGSSDAVMLNQSILQCMDTEAGSNTSPVSIGERESPYIVLYVFEKLSATEERWVLWQHITNWTGYHA